MASFPQGRRPFHGPDGAITLPLCQPPRSQFADGQAYCLHIPMQELI